VPRRCVLNCGRRACMAVRPDSLGQCAERRVLRLHDARVRAQPLDRPRVHCSAHAIDPLSPKNIALPVDLRDRIVAADGLATRTGQSSRRCRVSTDGRIPSGSSASIVSCGRSVLRCIAGAAGLHGRGRRRGVEPLRADHKGGGPRSQYSRRRATSPALATSKSTPSSPARRS